MINLDEISERIKIQARPAEEMSLLEYLELAKKDSSAYAGPHERLLKAIGEPRIIHTDETPRLSRLFKNRTIKIYDAFDQFYGAEEVIEKIVGFLKHGAQGLEEKKQVLYLLGPVGGGKSSLSERLKELMEKEPFYAIKDSPINENPLGLFNKRDADKLGIPERYLKGLVSPWLTRELEHKYQNDITQLRVVKLYPSQRHQRAIAKVEPGDENNQDISSLVGKVDIRKLERWAQSDPYAYDFSGGLCKANRGLLEFVEMFKAPIKTLHPLLTATQEGNYNGSEAGMASIPFEGIILAHSNEAEWETFKGNKNNEAFLDRTCLIKVPNCLRVDENTSIFNKLVKESDLATAKCAPYTMEMLSRFLVLTRLVDPENSDINVKMLVYNGESLKDKTSAAKSLEEYKNMEGTAREGMDGLSSRWGFKALSKVFNFDTDEVAANPVHLLYILEKTISEEYAENKTTREKYLSFIKQYLQPWYVRKIGEELQTAFLESYKEYGQSLFDNYIRYAEHWIEDTDYRDPETGTMLDRDTLNQELEALEKPAGIGNPKDFRHEVVNFCLRHRANNKGNNPEWTGYAKLAEVIKSNLFNKTEDLLPVISFGKKANKDDDKKHQDFLKRMTDKGYTVKQVKLLVDWHAKVRKSS